MYYSIAFLEYKRAFRLWGLGIQATTVLLAVAVVLGSLCATLVDLRLKME
jgi:hypothetical protein